MAASIRPELLARFGNAPDALEWARGVVQEAIDLVAAIVDLPQADPQMRKIAAWTASYMKDQLVGGHGEISPHQPLGRFDARLAADRAATPER